MRIILGTAALLVSGYVFAATPVDGMYTRVFGGYTYVPGNVDTNAFFGGFRNRSSYNDGYNAGGAFGYQSNPLRYEAEYTYVSAKTQAFNLNFVPQLGVTGESLANLLMANIYYDCPELLPSVAPYLGVGIGYAYIQSSLNSRGPNGPTFFKTTDNAFAYQATAGLNYNFAENYGLNIGYRYASTGSLTNLGSTFQAHIVNAGVTYHFDQGNYK
jgi:opacity protein-like surface antigen